MLDKIDGYSKDVSSDLIVWGISSYLIRTLRRFAKNGIRPVCLTDSDRDKWGYKYSGIECERPIDAIKKYQDALFYIASPTESDSIVKQLVSEYKIPLERIINHGQLYSDEIKNEINNSYIVSDCTVYDENIADIISCGEKILQVSINCGMKEPGIERKLLNLKKYASDGKGELIHFVYKIVPGINDALLEIEEGVFENQEIDLFIEVMKRIGSKFVTITSDHVELPDDACMASGYLARRLYNQNIIFEVHSKPLREWFYPPFTNRTRKAFVFTCAYNAEKTIERTIDSVLNQTFDDFDYYIVNNGSTDRTQEIIMKYESIDRRVFMIQCNVNDLRNTKILYKALCRSSNSTYATRIDADDVMHEDFLETMISFADEYDLDVAACGYHKVDGVTGEIISSKQSDKNFVISGDGFRDEFINYRGFTIYLWAKIFNLDFYNRSRLHSFNNEELTQATDSNIMLSIINKSKRFGVVGRPMFDYYIHGDALSFNLSDNIYESFISLYESTRKFIELRGDISSENENFLHCIYLSILDEVVTRVLGQRKMTKDEKISVLRSLFTDKYTNETFSFVGESQFRNLAAREEYLDTLENRINATDLKSSMCPLIEILRKVIPK